MVIEKSSWFPGNIYLGPSKESLLDSLISGSIFNFHFINSDNKIVIHPAMVSAIERKKPILMKPSDDLIIELVIIGKKFTDEQMDFFWRGEYSIQEKTGRMLSDLTRCLII